MAALRQEDLQSYIATWERPDSAVFGVAGAALHLCTFPADTVLPATGTNLSAVCKSLGDVGPALSGVFVPAGVFQLVLTLWLLTLTGDFESSAMKQLIERTLGPWQVAAGQPAEPLAVPNPPLPAQSTPGQVRGPRVLRSCAAASFVSWPPYPYTHVKATSEAFFRMQ